jgi:hypothetical protein
MKTVLFDASEPDPKRRRPRAKANNGTRFNVVDGGSGPKSTGSDLASAWTGPNGEPIVEAGAAALSIPETTPTLLPAPSSPQLSQAPSALLSAREREYAEFMRIRTRIRNCIRGQRPEKQTLVAEIAEALIDCEKCPEGLVSLGLFFVRLAFGLGGARKKKKCFVKVVNALLEQIFDPQLRFRMTKQQIVDAFHANGVARDKVTISQIERFTCGFCRACGWASCGS